MAKTAFSVLQIACPHCGKAVSISSQQMARYIARLGGTARTPRKHAASTRNASKARLSKQTLHYVD